MRGRGARRPHCYDSSSLPGDPLARLGDLVAELRRRRVIRALLGWGVFSFAVLQVVEPVLHAYHLPEWTLTAVVSVVAAGFPVTVFLAWVFDLGVKGITRTAAAAEKEAGAVSGPRLVLFLLAVGLLASAPGFVYFFVWPGAMRRPAGASPAKPAAAAASIAVLPFANLSADRDQEFFADGIAEEILNALAQIDGLRVAGRTSSFAFKGKNEDLAGIAQKLRVGAVLEGSVRKEGSRVRVTAQLINAADGYHLWSQTFERELTGVFAIQDEIARAVASALRGRLLPKDAAAPPARPTTTPDAYSKYLLARHFIALGHRQALLRAAQALEECVALDPRYAPAWASLSYALFWAVQHETTPAEQVAFTARARDAADRAVALAPDLPDGYAMRGFLRLARSWDWRGAEADMDRALALGLTDAGLIRLNARFVMAPQGRLSEAITALQGTVERDPLSSTAWASLGTLLTYRGRHGEAATAFHRSLEISPENPISQSLESYNLAVQGRGEEALTLARRIREDGWRLISEACALQALGRRGEADRALAELKQREGGTMAYQIATFHAWRGDREEAFAWYDRALAQEDGGMSDILIDSAAEGLRDDRRYKAILARMHLPADAVVR